MISFCPRCGAQFSQDVQMAFARTSVRCRDCGLAPADAPPMLTPADDEEAELGYELSDWPVTDRVPVTAALAQEGIPYRWEEALTLVVSAEHEAAMDRLFADLVAVGADPVDAADGDSASGESDLDDEEDDADGGEEAYQAMSELFVAADRLKDQPFDELLSAEFSALAESVGDLLPPYGIERPVWRRVQDRASAIVAALDAGPDGADEEAVAADARTLRDLLRRYV